MSKGTDPIWSDAIFEVAEVDGNTVTLGDGTKYKRTDLLIVPKGFKYGGIHPVNAQLRENRLEREKLKEAKELAYTEARTTPTTATTTSTTTHQNRTSSTTTISHRGQTKRS